MDAKTPTPGRTAVLPFTQLADGALDAVFADQVREWRERLGWDLDEINALIGDAVGTKALRGSALFVGDAPAGFGFFTVEVDRCLIGDLYVTPRLRTPEANAALVTGLLAQVRRAKVRRRIESQSILFDSAGADEAFAEQGFARYERAYLAVALDGSVGAEASGHSRVRVRPWRDDDFGTVVDVIHRSYQGSVDSRVNCQYRTQEGCADLLDALTDSPWCGRFEPLLTQVAVDSATGRTCGVTVASAISPEMAHLSQISVLPTHQGAGVGRAMIRTTLAAAREAGFARASLAVTRENFGAARLYASLGFDQLLEFPVFTREAQPLTSRRG
jgi:ribosomal protein S18 acetylase RimI-like enzyme